MTRDERRSACVSFGVPGGSFSSSLRFIPLHAVSLSYSCPDRGLCDVDWFAALTFSMVGRASGVVAACVTAACILLEPR